ncbi:hypothetical protein BDV06DRAFT_186002 [Aspergillus oleicola]
MHKTPRCTRQVMHLSISIKHPDSLPNTWPSQHPTNFPADTSLRKVAHLAEVAAYTGCGSRLSRSRRMRSALLRVSWVSWVSWWRFIYAHDYQHATGFHDSNSPSMAVAHFMAIAIALYFDVR